MQKHNSCFNVLHTNILFRLVFFIRNYNMELDETNILPNNKVTDHDKTKIKQKLFDNKFTVKK